MEKIRKINNNQSNFCKAKSYYLSSNVFCLWSDLLSTKGGERYKIITDHLGSVRYVVRVSDGAIVQEMEYDSFGNVIYDTDPGFTPFGFAGGLYDKDTGLIRFGARDYDPGIGRWTSKDPILFFGGDPNFYAYIINEPVNNLDTFGLWTLGYGYTFSAGFAGMLDFQVSLVYDSKLNVGLLIGPGAGGIGGTTASATVTYQWTNADNIYQLGGICLQAGASAGAGFLGGAEAVIGDKNVYEGFNLNIEAGLPLGPYAVPIEVHAIAQKAKVIKLFNIKEIALSVWKTIKKIF